MKTIEAEDVNLSPTLATSRLDVQFLGVFVSYLVDRMQLVQIN